MASLLFIDTETGGLDSSRHSILSLGAVVWKDGDVVDSFEAFISEPEVVVDKRAMEINQIDITWLKNHGLPPIDVLETFHKFLEKNFEEVRRGGKIFIAGHNVDFDVGFLKRLYRLTGFDFGKLFSHRVLDTASVIKFLSLAGRLSLPEASSSAAFKHFDIKFDKGLRHTALGDAMATAYLMNKLLTLIRRH